MEYGNTIRLIRMHLADYIINNRIKSLIIGISGGIDSTLCAALARPVCDSLTIPLIGRALHTATNKPDEVHRAKMVGEVFCHDFAEIPIDGYFTAINKICLDNGQTNQDYKEKIRLGNIKSRLRMMILYDLAQKKDGMVLSTDNYTEFMVGFWTLHGDVGDFGMIQNYWKTEVYEMSKWLVLQEELGRESIQLCIDAVPTDGLGITSSDLEQLGAKTYEEVDSILQEYFDLMQLVQVNGISKEIVGRLNLRCDALQQHPVIQRHLKTIFKRKNPYNLKRMGVN